MQNKSTARHSVHRLVEESCGGGGGGGRVSSTGLITTQLLLAILINVEALCSSESLLTFQ